MKKLLILLALIPFGIQAQQAVVIRIVTNDGSVQATNIVNLSSDKVSGLISLWNKDSQTKTNAGGTAISFNAFITQELSDKGAEWALQGAKDAIKTAGVTNAIPDNVARKWFTLSATQQTNVVTYLNTVQP